MTWPLAPLGTFADVQLGKMLSPKAKTGVSSCPYLRNVNVQWGSLELSDLLEMDFDEDDRAKFEIRRGDLLVCEGGEPGRCAVVPEDLPGIYFQKALMRVRPRDHRLDTRFLQRFMEHTARRGTFMRDGNQATIAHFPAVKLNALEVPIPSPREQRRIADILDKADAIRRKRKQAIALTEELLRSAFLDMFGDPVTNPNGWEIRELNDFIASERPITYGILKPGPDTPGGVPYVRVVDIRGGEVSSRSIRRTSPQIDHEYRRSRLKAGDLLMSIRGHVGRLAVVPEDLDGANITQDTARIAPVGLDPSYLMHLLETPATQFWMSQHVRGVAVQGINIGDVRRIPVPVPPKDRQAKFATLVRNVIRLRVSARDACVSSEALLGSLTQKVFAGGIQQESSC